MDNESAAVEALKKIAEHEKECAARWGAAAVELRELKETTKTHARRWEKLAWLLVATMLSCALTIILGITNV